MEKLIYGCISIWIIALLISVINTDSLIEGGFALSLIFMILKMLE